MWIYWSLKGLYITRGRLTSLISTLSLPVASPLETGELLDL